MAKKQQNNSREYQQFNLGKLPPQSREMEEAVIGACLIGGLKYIENILHAEIFYLEAHKSIVRAILELRFEDSPVDLLTVVHKLRANEELQSVGGIYYLTELTNRVASSVNIEYHLRIIFQKYVARQLIQWGHETTQGAFDESNDIFDLLDRGERNFREIHKMLISGEISNLKQILEKTKQQSKQSFIPSKHRIINDNCRGWSRGGLHIVAARPGMGKSAWGVSELIHFIGQGSKVLMFNLEMTEMQLVERIKCNYTGISNYRLRNDEIHSGEYEKLAKFDNWFLSCDRLLTLDFTGGGTINDIDTKAHHTADEKGLDVILVDYLQLVRTQETKGKNRDNIIGEITSGLKSLAKNLNVAIIAFCQLSRATENNKGKRPNMQELRESGNIEQDADTISFILRPEYYFKKDHRGKIIYEGDEEEFKDIAQWLCDKNRDGYTYEFEMKCNLGTSCFYDLEVAPENNDFSKYRNSSEPSFTNESIF